MKSALKSLFAAGTAAVLALNIMLPAAAANITVYDGASSSIAYMEQVMYTTTRSLLYDNSSDTKTAVGEIESGEQVEVTGYDSAADMYMINNDGYVYFIKAQNLTDDITVPVKYTLTDETVWFESVVVWSSDGLDGVETDTLYMGDTVYCIGDKLTGYTKVQYNNQTGYVNTAALTTDENMVFQPVEETYTRFITQNTTLYCRGIVESELPRNGIVTVTAENGYGYCYVDYKGTTGYIPSDYLSEEETPSALQLKVAELALNDEGLYPCEENKCAQWVEGIYESIGIQYPGSFGNAIDYWEMWKDSGSSDLSSIPVGAVLVSCGGGSEMSQLYGHVAIYIGDGMIAENIGYHHIQTLDAWLSWQVGSCRDYTGCLGWVWPYGIDLSQID